MIENEYAIANQLCKNTGAKDSCLFSYESVKQKKANLAQNWNRSVLETAVSSRRLEVQSQKEMPSALPLSSCSLQMSVHTSSGGLLCIDLKCYMLFAYFKQAKDLRRWRECSKWY